MKRLFLASVVANTIDQLVNFVEAEPNNLKVAFISTAADPYEDKSFIEVDRRALVEAGFNVIDVDIKNKKNEDLLKELKDMSIVLVAGGNTFYLLQEARKSGFDKVVKDLINDGVVYMGSSAGAVLVGPNIEPVASIDDPSKAPTLTSNDGLNIVDFVALPHYGEGKYKTKLDAIIKKFGNKYKIIPINNNQAVAVEGDSYQIVGP